MTRRQKAIGFFVTLCVLLVGAAVSLNVGWIMINARRLTPLVLGIVLFALIIAGIIIYTVFLASRSSATKSTRPSSMRSRTS